MLSMILGIRGVAPFVYRRHNAKLLKSIVPKLCGSQVAITARRHYRCDAHMNELPVPCGPWEPWYSDKQRFYNKVLIGGILWWLFSLGMMLYTDSIFLNWGPPAQPAPPSDLVGEDCDDF